MNVRLAAVADNQEADQESLLSQRMQSFKATDSGIAEDDEPAIYMDIPRLLGLNSRKFPEHYRVQVLFNPDLKRKGSALE